MKKRVPVTQSDDRRVIAGILLWLLVGCQMAPTVVRETGTPGPSTDYPTLVLQMHPAILDARSPLDFGVSHVPGAVNVQWTDFTQPGARAKGTLDADDRALSRRLALWGIDRETPVLVIGDGPKAHGEEAWIAWMLESLGVKNVHVGTPDQYRGQIPRENERPPNKSYWKPEVNALARATPAEGRKFLSGSALAFRAAKRVVLDVRGEPEVKGLPLATTGWKGEALNIPWREFFNPDGQPSDEGLKKLQAAGWTGHEEILIVSEHGLESGAVAYALTHLKFGRPRNLIAGLRGLGSGK